MNRTTGRVLAALLAGGVFALSACSSGNGKPAGRTTGSPAVASSDSPAANGAGSSAGVEEGASIKLWLSSDAAASTTESLAKSWAEQNGVKLSVETIASPDFQQSLQLALKTGNAPDVFVANDIRSLVNAGTVLPLDNLLPADITTAYKSALEPPKPYIVDGHVYTIPLTATTFRLVYNKDMFKNAGLDPNKPPTTFGEMAKDCEAIASKGGYCIGAPLKYNAFVNLMMEPTIADTQSALTVGGLFDTKAQKFDFIALKPAVEFYREAVQKKWVYLGASSLDNDSMRAAFAQGKIGMYEAASYDYAELVDKYHTTIDWGVSETPIPDGTTAVRSVTTLLGGYAVQAKTKYPHAAAALLAYLAGKDAVEKTLDAGAFPVRSDVTPSENSSQYKAFAMTSHDSVYLTSPSKVVDITGKTFKQVVISLILGKDDIDSALNDLDSRYDKAYQTGISQGQIKPSDYSS